MVATAPVPLVSLFTEVDDPRRPQARRHDLEDILLIATLAVICGADSWTEVELFGRQKQAWLETFLDLPHGIPSHDTFGRVFARLDPAQPGSALRAGYGRWRWPSRTRSCRWTARWPAAPAMPSGGCRPCIW